MSDRYRGGTKPGLPSASYARALHEAKRRSITPDLLIRDVAFLLDQLGTIAHLQDREGIEEVRKRYAWEH